MLELLRTTDAVLISFVSSLLNAAGIALFVADDHVSGIEGSIGIFPRRILVDEEDLAECRSILTDAGLEHQLPPLG